MTRGKCQACGRWDEIGRVAIQVKGATMYDKSLCRRCCHEILDGAIYRTREIQAARP